MTLAGWPEGLDGRVALVTDAASPVGYACARLLADTGARVALTGPDESVRARAARLAAETAPPSDRAEGCSLGVVADLRDQQSVAALVDEVSGALGPVDVLVSVTVPAPAPPVPVRLSTLGLDEWHASLATSLDPVFLVTRAVLPGMLARGWGRVVTVVVPPPAPGHAGVTTAHRALLGFTGAVAAEAAGGGVTCNAVVPVGLTGAAEAPTGWPAPGPAGQATDAEVAAVVAFLASTAAGHVTGQTVTVGGRGPQAAR